MSGRVRILPHTDAFMRGMRYGTIEYLSGNVVKVRADNGVLLTLNTDDIGPVF